MECSRTNQQPEAKEAKQFWSKIWEQKEHNRRAKVINNIEKELRGFKEGSEADILVMVRATIKKVL